MRLAAVLFYCRHPTFLRWRKFGFNPTVYQTLTTKAFQQLGIKTIVDIGANTGQSVITFKAAFPEAVIHAVEPLPACYRQLSSNVAGLEGIRLHNVAVGDQEGRVVMEENGYSPSSSLLTITDRHIENFPFTNSRKLVNVNVSTLDNLLRDEHLVSPILIKMDVQGYEKNVIMGGSTSIGQAKALIVETSFETLYDGQPLFDEIYALLVSLGFRYAGAFDQLASPLTGTILQQDALFIRP